MAVLMDYLALIGVLCGVLGLFTGVIFWAVKVQVSSLKTDHHTTSEKLQIHIDTRLDRFESRQNDQEKSIKDHEKRLHEREVEQLKMRNDVLESMRSSYVRHSDITEIKKQIQAIFDRLDKVVFGPGPNNGGGGH